MSPRLFLSILFFATLLAVLPSFGSKNTQELLWKNKFQPKNKNWQKTEQHFIFNNGTEPETLDPALITGHPEFRLVMALFEGLVNLDPETLEPRPGLALRWDIDSTQTRYTFHLRKNAMWSNGQAITAKDFLNSWKRALLPETASQYAYQFFPIQGAEDFNQSQIKDFAQVGIKVKGPHELEVTLHHPCPYFLDLVAFPTLYPVPMDVVTKHKDRWVLPENIVSNGAFRLSEWEARKKIVLLKSETYWDRNVVKLNQITALSYDDLDTAYKLFKKDKIHWMTSIPLPKLDEIKRDPDYYVMPFMGTYFYRFNVKKAPFDDVRVRQALSLVIDRKVITTHILKAGQIPATWFCPDVGGYRHVDGLKRDRDLAKKLLKEAGYGPSGKAFPEVELLFNTSESHKKVAESIVAQWRDTLGIQVSLANKEWKVVLDNMKQLDYQVCRSSWIGDYGDPNTFFDMWVTDGGNNRTGWSNKDYDSLLQKSQLEADPKKRMALFAEMEKILIEKDFPILPLYIYVNQGLLKESVYGWYENTRDLHPFKYLWLDDSF